MADVAEPGTCQACGRTLPSQQGRGRIRRYCDARCRDVARRERERLVGQRTPLVKNNLTMSDRHVYVDDIDGMLSTDDPVAVRVAGTARHFINEFTHGDSPGEAVAAARELSVAAEAALQAAVDRARVAGQSWREIGDVLGTSKQAAFQRFGHPIDPRTGVPMTRDIPPGTIERATEFLASFTAARWEEVLDHFDEPMRERHDADRLAAGWARMISTFGNYEGMGEVSPLRLADNVVVDVLLHFEAGDAMVWARFNRDGKISGLRLHPAPS
jgi:Protein of unknown function (DUF3887)